MYDPDRRLQLRIALAVLLILSLPFAFAVAFQTAVNAVGLPLLAWATERPYHGRFYVDPVLLAAAVAVGFLLQIAYGPRAVLSSVDARRVDEADNPDLHARVNRLAQIADVDPPAVAVATSRVPNAFAVGRPPRDATVCVTTGLLDALDDDELDAVLAHEIAHVKHDDATVMTVAWLLPTVTFLVATAAYYVLYGLGRGLVTARPRGGNRDGRALVVAIVVVAVSALVTLALSALFWAASVLLHRVLARYREYAADRGAAAITGDPAALASALATLDAELVEAPETDLRALDGGGEALYVVPLEARDFGDAELVSTDVFPATHPPTDERIDRLRDLAAAGER